MTGVRSERASLATILTLCNAADRLIASMEMDGVGLHSTERLTQVIGGIRDEARALQSQVMQVPPLHVNPPLAVYLNPPLRLGPRRGRRPGGRFDWVSLMSRHVHEIRYTHEEDSRDYKHTFDSGDVEMYAIRRGDHLDVLLTGGSGQDLWQDF